MERITKSWKTTTLGILVLIAIVFLLYTKTIEIKELEGLITILAGGAISGLLVGAKDPKKKE